MTSSEQVVFVGGPYHGEHGTIPAGRDRWYRPLPMPLPVALDDAVYTVAELHEVRYRLRLDPTGYPSRRDDGRLVFELDDMGFTPPPVSTAPTP